ncbi:MAG TPA: Bax inhibitor-1 family protein [Chloroflexia bacterium]|nr:Bax inhibitor-1 family protein [Chloroflexia bacterium]
MAMSNSVWTRQGAGTLSKNLYAFLICMWTAVGIGASAVAASLSRNWGLDWLLMIGSLVFAIIGVIISAKSDNPAISFMGFMLVAVPFGLLLGPVVSLYTDASVARVLTLTTVIVVVLGIIGAVVPASLESWRGWLFGGLLLLLGGMFLVPLMGLFGVHIGGALTALDWFGVVLFGGYVIYDLNRAMRIAYTLDNSVDAAVAIYLDFFNIFIRLLSLLGEKD